MTSFLILPRSDTKDSTSFLIAAFFCASLCARMSETVPPPEISDEGEMG